MALASKQGHEGSVPEYLVTNLNRGVVIATRVRIAGTSSARRKGLLDFEELPSGFGLWIAPCEAIHTFGMKVALDALFLDKGFRVRKAIQNLSPRRFSVCVSASSVLEIEAGAITRSGTEAGHRLEFQLL